MSNQFKKARVRLTLETLQEIEDAVIEGGNDTFVDGVRHQGCPPGEEATPEVLRFRIDNAVQIYCAMLISESQK
jgi:hypothetical protein